tara:strand:- start:518 stop:1003 length:486 start_codon:yes stop_codon:yes gene_type:complete
MMNRRGALGDQAFFSVTFFIMLVIAAGVVGGTYIYFGGGYDFKAVESGGLSYEVGKCLIDEGTDDLENTFYEKCKIDEDVLKEGNLIRICKNLGEDECLEAEESDLGVEFNVGSNFVICKLEGAKENKNFGKCDVKTVSVEGDDYVVIVMSNREIKREQTT